MMEALGVVGITLAGVAAYSRYQKLSGQLKAEQDRYATLFTKLLAAEELRTKTQSELDFLKQSVIQMLQRSVIATLTDQQVHDMVSALVQYAASIKDPGKLN